jgi:NDP-sugar pyrophosphorylase family protein
MNAPLKSAASARCLGPVDVFVLAGGLGTRIQPVLGDVPKLLAPIGGRPFIDFLFDWLRGFGARRVVLGLGHRAQAIRDYLADHPPEGITIETVLEPRPLGTAGAIRFARHLLHSDPVLVMNGDSFVAADLCDFVERHQQSNARATILCTDVPDAGRYGRVVLDGAGHIVRFAEKDRNAAGHGLINAGVYLLSAALLNEIATGDAVSLERDVFERMAHTSLAGVEGTFDFVDIGTPESLAGAAEIICRHLSRQQDRVP